MTQKRLSGHSLSGSVDWNLTVGQEQPTVLAVTPWVGVWIEIFPPSSPMQYPLRHSLNGSVDWNIFGTPTMIGGFCFSPWFELADLSVKREPAFRVKPTVGLSRKIIFELPSKKPPAALFSCVPHPPVWQERLQHPQAFLKKSAPSLYHPEKILMILRI